MNKNIEISFVHGLGDCSNAAHLLQLWKRRGYEIWVNSDLNKKALFEAAGFHFDSGPGYAVHPWSHPPNPPLPALLDSWTGNKTGWNLKQPPLPDIGSPAELWSELCSVRLALASAVTDEDHRLVNSFTKDLMAPVVLVHTRGNNMPGTKNLSTELEEDIYSALLDQTPASLILLDWDRRVARCHRWRVRHLEEDFQRLELGALWLLMERSACLVCIDSGPLHFARFSRIPAIGLWTQHHPAHYALPSNRAIHLVESSNGSRVWNIHRRHSFSVVEIPKHSGNEVAKWVNRILDSRPNRICCSIGPELLLESMIEKCNHRFGGPNGDCDRDRTFPLFMRLAQRCAESHPGSGPQILSTGSIRQEEDWTAGFSDYLFGYWLGQVGGSLKVVEIDPKRADFARAWTAPYPVEVHTSHSHDFLRQYSGPLLDGFYSDSLDLGESGYADCCLGEVQLVLQHLRRGAPILIDDSYYGGRAWHGKGALAIPYLMQQGWRVGYSGHQTLLLRD